MSLISYFEIDNELALKEKSEKERLLNETKLIEENQQLKELLQKCRYFFNKINIISPRQNGKSSDYIMIINLLMEINNLLDIKENND
jgi:hypothetical protein